MWPIVNGFKNKTKISRVKRTKIPENRPSRALEKIAGKIEKSSFKKGACGKRANFIYVSKIESDDKSAQRVIVLSLIIINPLI
jgi:hypothetical protein